MSKRTVVFDFDGVIHKYSKGWQDGSIYDGPNPGILFTIDKLRASGYEVVVVSSRCATPEGITAIDKWLKSYGIIVDRICKEKPPAAVYVDDRAIKYDPDCKNLFDQIDTFQPYQKIRANYEKLSELEILGMLQLKNRMFKEANDLFDKNAKRDPILSIMMMDDWIQAVIKYCDGGNKNG